MNSTIITDSLTSIKQSPPSNNAETSKPPLETVIESGPVHETEAAADHNDYEAEEHEDEGIVTASSLFAKQIDCEFFYLLLSRPHPALFRYLRVVKKHDNLKLFRRDK